MAVMQAGVFVQAARVDWNCRNHKSNRRVAPMIRHASALLFFSILIFLPSESIAVTDTYVEFTSGKVIVHYKKGEEITNTLFRAMERMMTKDTLEDYRMVVILKDWLTHDERVKLLPLLMHLEQYGYIPVVEAVQSPYNGWLSRMTRACGGYFFERLKSETAGVCSPVVNQMDGNSVLVEREVGLPDEGAFTEKVWVDPSVTTLQVLHQTESAGSGLTLVAPDGSTVQPKLYQSLLHSFASVGYPQTGEWQITIKGKGRHFLQILGMTPNKLKLNSPMFFDKSGEVFIAAGFTDESEKLKNVIGRVEIRDLLNRDDFQQVKLFDDGNHGDGSIGDGVFGTRLTMAEGTYQVRVVVEGERIDGGKLQRTKSYVLRVGAIPPVTLYSGPVGLYRGTEVALKTKMVTSAPMDKLAVKVSIDGSPAQMVYSDPKIYEKMYLYDVTLTPTKPIDEGHHIAELAVMDSKQDTVAYQDRWEFDFDRPVSSTLVINEVMPFPRGGWVELMSLEDGVDLRGYALSDMEASPLLLTKNPFVLAKGEIVLIKFEEGRTEDNATGDINGNKIREVYIPEAPGFSRKMDQIVLWNGSAMIDAVAWTSPNSRITKEEQKDIQKLVSRGEWEPEQMLVLGRKDESLARRPSVPDSNKILDWAIGLRPSPGRPNLGSHTPEHAAITHPPVGSVVINEVAPLTEGPMWAELYVVSGPVDISNFVLSDMDGDDEKLSEMEQEITISSGEYVLVHWDARGKDEIEGDLNRNGARDFYVSDERPSTTDDQLTLSLGGVVYDAVCWSDWNTEIGKSEIADIDALIQVGQWDGVAGSGEAAAVEIGPAGRSVGRLANGVDANKKDDWAVQLLPTPGKPNVRPPAVPKGSVLIVEVYPYSKDRDYAVLYCVNGPVDISAMSLSDLDGIDEPLASDPVTLNTGDKVTVHWDRGIDETDKVGDFNKNSVRDLYISDAHPATTDDQIVLMWGSMIYDAVVWTNGDGEMAKDELQDARYLVNKKEWAGGYSDPASQKNSVIITTANPLLRRRSISLDTNQMEDWR